MYNLCTHFIKNNYAQNTLHMLKIYLFAFKLCLLNKVTLFFSNLLYYFTFALLIHDVSQRLVLH